MSRCRVHLAVVVRLYTATSGRTEYERRAAAGDRTVLHDALTLTIDELVEVREEVIAAMDSGAPTKAKPGSTDKVEEMRLRAARGESLWQRGDRDDVG